jgi:hydrogenase nickel incorporation protein HypA/HybF
MHETALVRDFVRRIDQIARAAGASHVIGAKVWLGALSHLSAEHFREHFAVEARNTLASTAALEIEVSAIRQIRMPSTCSWRASNSKRMPDIGCSRQMTRYSGG